MSSLIDLVVELAIGAVTSAVNLALSGIASTRPQSHGASRWAGARDRNQLGRTARAEQAAGDGMVLGFLGWRLLQSPAEDNVLLLGVQRSGKTSMVVVPTLLSWTGSVVATSTKEELIKLTAKHRATLGPVSVFAPLDRDTSWLDGLGLSPATWNPIRSLADCASAAELADHFTAAGKRGDSAHWYLSASSLLTGLSILAKERGEDMGFVLTTLNRTAHADYAELAKKVADPLAADLIVAHSLTPDREAGSTASTARASLGLWVDERVRLATSANASDLDLDRLLAERGSLYLVAPAEEAERCRPLFSALLATLLRKSTARARAQGGVLSPRLLVALDEAANFARLPRLAAYASSGPGQGIQLLLCFHDLAQIEAIYGREVMRTVWNNCRARLLLPGQGDLATLEQFSRAIGDETRTYHVQQGAPQRLSSAEQRIGRPLCSPDDLRRIRDAVLIYASAPPVRLKLKRWDQVSHFRQLAGGGGQCRLIPAPPFLRSVHSGSPLARQGRSLVLVVVLRDINVHPDLGGLPANVVAGLSHLANNAAGLLVVVSGLGIAISLIGWVVASFTGNPQLAERSKSSLGVSVAAVALLYLGIAAANYAGRLFS